MRYLGGKQRLAKHIGNYLLSNYNFDNYIEPFCGSAAVGLYIKKTKQEVNIVFNDISEDLILMWKALQEGWIPPSVVTEEEYKELRRAKSSALRGFAAHGVSWSGRFFGGYARCKRNEDFCGEARNSLLKVVPLLTNCQFYNLDYRELEIMDSTLLYCDPPYLNTTGYKFNTELFWDWAREKSKSNIVIVSEYVAPQDFEVMWEKEINMNTRTKEGSVKRVEKLFRLRQ